MPVEELISSLIGPDGRFRIETAGSDRSTKYQFVFHQHIYLNNASRFADLKAAALAGVSGTLLGLILREFSLNEATPVELFAFIAGACVLFAGIAMALWVVYPRRQARYQKSYLYWEGVRVHNSEEFTQALMSISSGDLLKHFIQHNYLLSGILSKKYSTLNQAFLISMVGYVILGFAIIFENYINR